MVPGGRGRTQRKDELRRQENDDTIQGLVVKAKRAPSAPSMDELDDHLSAGHAEYPGWCPLYVAGRRDRASMILVPRLWEGRWLVTHPVSCKGAEHRWIVGKLVNDVIMSDMHTLVV